MRVVKKGTVFGKGSISAHFAEEGDQRVFATVTVVVEPFVTQITAKFSIILNCEWRDFKTYFNT